MVPKKTVLVIAFRIALTLDVKIVWFGRQMAVCVKNWHKNAIFGCSWFQKFNFSCLLKKLLICSPKAEHIFNFVFPLWIWSSIVISGTQIYFTLFLALSQKSWGLVIFFEKVIYYVIALLHNLFIILTNLEKTQKYLWRSYKDFSVYNM